jgi:formyltetrahydrofolate-dependent phosphoribosylglycinamide formyltransferase
VELNSIANRKRIAIFISGTGSNLNAALEMRDHVDIALVVTSRRKALGVLKAHRAGVPVFYFAPSDWSALEKSLTDYKIDFIFLLGFMKIIPGSFVAKWKGRILNIHPSLLPSYPGLDSIRKCYEDHQPLGVTVHEVTEEMDAGPIVYQRKVARGEDLESTEFNVHRSEHKLVREVLWNLAAI